MENKPFKTIGVELDVYQRLALEKISTGKSIFRLVREAVDCYLGKEKAKVKK